MIENELSFLVASLPDIGSARKKEIAQHYLSDGTTPLRLRAIDGQRFELTKKLPTAPGDLSRLEEITIPVDAAEYEMLAKLAKRSILKTRYLVPLSDGLTAELDVFHGSLDGLVMVEVEFADDASRARFVPPPWFGRDISQEEWSTNAYLAGKTFEEIRKNLKSPRPPSGAT